MNKRQPTSKDVAIAAGVSKSTVSFVLNGRMDISIPKETRAHVLEVAKNMGYRPNFIAKALATGATQLIMLQMPGIYTPYYARASYQIRAELRKSGYRLLVSDYESFTDFENEHDLSVSMPVDGIMMLDSLRWLNDHSDLLESMTIPVVNLGVRCPQNTDNVRVDLYPASVQATQYLINSAGSNIVYITYDDTDEWSDPRFEAYKATMTEAGLPTSWVFSPSSDPEDVSCSLKSYIKENGYPKALFCRNNQFALGVYRALRELGIRAQNDIPIIGCGTAQDTEILDPPLSTIAHPLEEMCTVGWQFLHARILDRSIPQQEALLQAQLLIRSLDA